MHSDSSIDFKNLFDLRKKAKKGGEMQANTRICIAYIAGSLINKKNYSSLIDHAENKTFKITGKFDLGNIDVQIHEGIGKIVGLVNGNEMSFFHSMKNNTIRMKIEGINFKGRDSGTENDFIGSVNGKTVKIYDYGEYQNFYFALGE
jgi:hypothetical protein